MRRNLIWGLNWVFLALIAIALGMAGFKHWTAEPLLTQPKIVERPTIPPSNPYDRLNLEYEKLGKPSLTLEFKVPSVQVPDLRQVIKYHGLNQRPDWGEGGERLFFTVGNSSSVVAVAPDSPQYLKRQDGNFSASPNNQPTDLWFEVKPQGVAALVSVSMKDPSGQVLSNPKERTVFTLPEKPLSPQEKTWQIGDFRVDGTLLARQKARWSGRDLFLEEHGGPPFAFMQGKQRISFGEKEKQYFVFVGPGDLLVWKGDRWQPASSKEETRGLSLMRVDKVDERILSATLFSPDGVSKITLNLLKIPDPIPQEDILKHFQFVGARTRVHFMFKIHGKREILGINDWYLFNSGTWEKLRSHNQIDAFVVGKLQGPLLIIHAIEINGGNRVLLATLFNTSRSASGEVQIPLTLESKIPVPQKSSPSPPPAPSPTEENPPEDL